MKYAAAALAAATAVSTLGGCEQLEKKAPEDTVAVSFGDTNIMLDDDPGILWTRSGWITSG